MAGGSGQPARAYRTKFAIAGLRTIPNDQFTAWINGSGYTPITSVAIAVTPKVAAMGSPIDTGSLSTACRMNMAFPMRM